jgi:hypothetical protein
MTPSRAESCLHGSQTWNLAVVYACVVPIWTHPKEAFFYEFVKGRLTECPLNAAQTLRLSGVQSQPRHLEILRAELSQNFL